MSEKPPREERRRGTGRRAGESVAGPGGPPLVSCPHCESTVPAGEFCGHCGAHLRTADVDRRHAFAAVPTEPVLHFNLITTLFPHLPHRRGGPFRWALIAGGLFVVILAALHLFAPATAAAAFLLPVLYLLYLYEVEVYADEPWLLVGATMLAGANRCRAARITTNSAPTIRAQRNGPPRRCDRCGNRVLMRLKCSTGSDGNAAKAWRRFTSAVRRWAPQ